MCKASVKIVYAFCKDFLIIATSFRKPVPHAMFNFLIYIEDEQKGTGGNTYAMGIYIINRNCSKH